MAAKRKQQSLSIFYYKYIMIISIKQKDNFCLQKEYGFFDYSKVIPSLLRFPSIPLLKVRLFLHSNYVFLSFIYFLMGNSKSHEFCSLLSPLKTQEWTVLQQRETHQLWQRRRDGRRFMAFPLNETLIDSEQKLQLYNFRKLNHGSLVAVDSILSNEGEYLCSFPKSKQILIENIPYTLAVFRRALNLSQAMTILSAAFAGYNTLNYVYGPLFTDETMIGFTEQGKPKVWVNPNFSTNQPSPFAVSGGEQFSAAGIEQRTYLCVQRIIDVVQGCLSGGYPAEFREEALRVGTFAEGEELVEGFSRHWGVSLADNIGISKFNRVQPLVFHTETHLHSDRVSLNTFPISTNNRILQMDHKNELSTHITTLNSQHPQITIQQIPINSQVLTSYRPLLLSTVNNNPKISFVVRTAVDSVFVRDRVASSPQNIQIPIQNNPKRTSNQEESVNSSHHDLQPVPTPNILPNDHPQINTVQSREQIQLHLIGTHNEDQEQALQLMHEVAQHEQIQDNQQSPQVDPPAQIDRAPTTESVDEGGAVLPSMESEFTSMEPFDELKKWEQSLIKLSAKKQVKKQSLPHRRQSSDERQYLSEERDQVFVEQPQVILFTDENDLQTYIRNKYRNFIESEARDPAENIQEYNYLQEERTDIYAESRRREPEVAQSSYFNQNYEVYEAQESVEELPHPLPKQPKKGMHNFEDADQRKYTFGKIELDPISAVQQYSKALQKQSGKKFKHRASIQLSSLEDKYSKYVKDRDTKSRSRFSSKDISAILKPEDTGRSSKREYLAREYLPDSIKESRVGPEKALSEEKGLTYDKLREMLWA